MGVTEGKDSRRRIKGKRVTACCMDFYVRAK